MVRQQRDKDDGIARGSGAIVIDEARLGAGRSWGRRWWSRLRPTAACMVDCEDGRVGEFRHARACLGAATRLGEEGARVGESKGRFHGVDPMFVIVCRNFKY